MKTIKKHLSLFLSFVILFGCLGLYGGAQAVETPPNTGKFIQAAAGGGHSLALKDDGTVWAWGNNSAGQCGVGVTGGTVALAQVEGLDNITIVRVEAGESHSMALDDEGNVWTWGSNACGQLGFASLSDVVYPHLVTFPYSAASIVEISAKGYSNIVIDDNGYGYEWGSYVQYGTPYSTTPAEVWYNYLSSSYRIGDITAVSAGYIDNILVSQGTVKNSGDSYAKSGIVPYPLEPVAVASGIDFAVVLASDGSVWRNKIPGAMYAFNLEQITGLIVNERITLGMQALSAGGANKYALKVDGSVWDVDTLAPALRFPDIAQMSAGGQHALAVREDGSIIAWGDDSYGQCEPFYREVLPPVVIDDAITYSGQIKTYAFTPTVSGVYTIYTLGGLDTEGYLYDSSSYLLEYDDDKDATFFYYDGHYDYEPPIDYNFRITNYLTANETYEVVVRTTTASYPKQVPKASTGPFRLIMLYASDILPMSGSELAYDPASWNSDWSSYYYNCYNYALDYRPGYSSFLQPGAISGQWTNWSGTIPEIKTSFIQACSSDAATVGGEFQLLDEDEAPPEGTYKVALVLAYIDYWGFGYWSLFDYHWYRQDDSGAWSHKPGHSLVRDTDSSWQTILNPHPDVCNTYVYNMLVGYFAVKAASDWTAPPVGEKFAKGSPAAPKMKMPAKNAFSLSEFDFLSAGLTADEVTAVLGEPNAQIGSGFLKDVYNLDDGRAVVLFYGMYRDQLYEAYVLAADGITVLDRLI